MVNYDNEFASLMQNAGHLVPFLDAYFGFLYRRTDFFSIQSQNDPSSKFGFTEGSAEKVVLAVVRRWQTHAVNEMSNAEKLKAASVPAVMKEVEIESESQELESHQPFPELTGTVGPNIGESGSQLESRRRAVNHGFF